MHDFDYDAMQKKRIARGATHMKRGSKSKKCSLPHDGLTAAQLRRLNGPVREYKLGEPMTKESFRALPENLQKEYIIKLQNLYQMNDPMLGKMFGISSVSAGAIRKKLGIEPMNNTRLTNKEAEIRDAKWAAFCNGVIGGKPGEVKEEEVPKVEEIKEIENPTENPHSTDEVAHVEEIYIPKPDRVDVSFTHTIETMDDLLSVIGSLKDIPTGKCKIRISIDKWYSNR